MGVRVISMNNEENFENATDWFADSDGTLQLYQTVDGTKTCVVEYAKGAWDRASVHPMPQSEDTEEKEQGDK